MRCEARLEGGGPAPLASRAGRAAAARRAVAPPPQRAAREAEPDDPEASESIDQRLGEQLPLDLPFSGRDGRDVRLGDYFGKRPVVLALVYYECPMLCTQVLNG